MNIERNVTANDFYNCTAISPRIREAVMLDPNGENIDNAREACDALMQKAEEAIITAVGLLSVREASAFRLSGLYESGTCTGYSDKLRNYYEFGKDVALVGAIADRERARRALCDLDDIERDADRNKADGYEEYDYDFDFWFDPNDSNMRTM